MESIPLSCYIRTFNEAKRIRPVIERVREIGAEVIVVDSGSSDGTQDIAATQAPLSLKSPGPGTVFRNATVRTQRAMTGCSISMRTSYSVRNCSTSYASCSLTASRRPGSMLSSW